jgi:hypothetical protein
MKKNNKHELGGLNKNLLCECGKMRFPQQTLCPLCFFKSQGLSDEEAKRRADLRLSRALSAKNTGHYHTGSRHGVYYWDEDDPVGVKRNHLVRYLLKQRVPLLEARLIASRKYQ